MADEKLIAVFVDYENLALGVKDAKLAKFDIDLILKRLLEKGRIVYKRAYCDWSQYRNEVRDLHGHGVEMIDIPRTKISGKNSADIHMVVDALDLSHSKAHIDVFALITGDSDFSPLASKLKENNKRVVGCGIRSSTSNLLIGCCDEFIYYDDLVRAKQKAKPKAKAGKAKSVAGKGRSKPTPDEPEILDQLVEIIRSLEQDYDPLWGSLIKQTIRRVYPGFNEQNAGYKNFADLLKDAEDRGYVDLDYDESRGNFIVHMRDE